MEVTITMTVTIIIILIYISGLPDFLIRMRQASKDYQQYKLMQQGAIVSDSDHLILSEEEEQVKIDIEENNEKSSRDYKDQEEDINDTNELDVTPNVQQDSDVADNEDKDVTTNTTTQEKQGLLHYFFFTKLFA